MSPRSSVPSLEESIKQHADSDIERSAATEKQLDSSPDSATEPISPFHPSQFPDGGSEAWLCLLGAACCLFCSFGWINCLGVFQSYYQTHQLSSFTPSEVSWISSCEIFVMFLPAPLVGFAYDNYGPKYLLVFGTFFHVFGLMMTSLCTEYWQFILAQGICSPLGLNCIFNAGTSSITTWFLKKRGAAYGMMAAGSGLGGIIFPIMVSNLIPKVGFGWAMRICAFMILGLLGIAILTVKSRLPPKKREFKLKVFLEPFSDTRFVLLTASSFLFFIAMFVPINFIELMAMNKGMSARLAGYLLAVLNAGSIFGRIIPGILVDKVGAYNMQAIMSYVCSVIVLGLALPASGNAAWITFAALYGFASGAYVSITPAQTAHISKVEQIGVRIGVLFSVVSFAGLAGNPIAGAIVTREHGQFRGATIFAGMLLLAGSVMFTITRLYVAKWKLITKV